MKYQNSAFVHYEHKRIYFKFEAQAKFSEHSNSLNERDKMIALLQSQLQKVQADSLVLTERIKRLNDENRLNGTLGLGSPDFLATNVSLDLNSYSLDSLRELKALVDRESEKVFYNYCSASDSYKCKWCEFKSGVSQNVRKHQASTHFKILVQYRASYGRYFIQILDELIARREI